MSPTFTHAGPGTPASAWQLDPRWTEVPDLDVDLASLKRLVVVAAHPDDETLGASGLLTRACDAGLDVHVVVVTNGEHSHPHSPSTKPDELASRRCRESVEALSVAAPRASITMLGCPDGGVTDVLDDVSVRLVDLLGDARDTLLVAPWRSDGHPDHEAAGRAAAIAAHRTGARLLEYPVWWWHWARPHDAVWHELTRLRLDDRETRLKVEAIACHESQVRPLSAAPGDETLLDAAFLEHFTSGCETFIVAADTAAADTSLDDLHESTDDPWGVDEAWYEERKRALTLACLPRRRFRHGLELGCSTGALAADLASRCEALLALDRSPVAVRAARARLATARHVTIELVDLADADQEWPAPTGEVDLIVLSEIGYFLSPRALDDVLVRVHRLLAPDGVVLLCHWRHPVDGWVLDASAVHQRCIEALTLSILGTYRDRDFEIVVLGDPSLRPTPHGGRAE